MAYCGDESYDEDVPSETYEPTYLRPKDQMTVGHLLPGLDMGFSALLDDMGSSGLLDETLVFVAGEMGRTPRGNTNWGRDHWGYCFPAGLAGAGIRGGAVYGRSDKDAAYPQDKPVSPQNLGATIFHALGIDPSGPFKPSHYRY